MLQDLDLWDLYTRDSAYRLIITSARERLARPSQVREVPIACPPVCAQTAVRCHVSCRQHKRLHVLTSSSISFLPTRRSPPRLFRPPPPHRNKARPRRERHMESLLGRRQRPRRSTAAREQAAAVGAAVSAHAAGDRVSRRRTVSTARRDRPSRSRLPKVREHSSAVEFCGPHIAISPVMLRSSNANRSPLPKTCSRIRRSSPHRRCHRPRGAGAHNIDLNSGCPLPRVAPSALLRLTSRGAVGASAASRCAGRSRVAQAATSQPPVVVVARSLRTGRLPRGTLLMRLLSMLRMLLMLLRRMPTVLTVATTVDHP